MSGKKKIVRSFFCTVIIFILMFNFTSCKKSDSEKIKSLNVGTVGITGNFNPFFAESEGDLRVINQVFRSVQRRNSNNKLVNSAGSISYELIGDKQVKYTVTIRNDLYFSDGSNVDIDDVIFFYYFISDAMYKGVYSDFYLNDIVGLKEYYYDSENYLEELKAINSGNVSDRDIEAYISNNYSDGINVDKISGINRVDNYTCTVLFNSRNINAISAINAVILSKDFYSVDYVKGSVSTVENIRSGAMGCGPYCIPEYKPGEKNLELSPNPFYYDKSPVFNRLIFRDYADNTEKMEDDIAGGKIDVASFTAKPSVINKLNSGSLKYFFNNSDGYISAFVNTSVLPEISDRKQLLTGCNNYDWLDSEYGSYYTRLNRPLSVRFEEYPSNSEAYFSGIAILQLIKSSIGTVGIYCVGDKNSVEYKLAQEFEKSLTKSDISVNIVTCNYDELKPAVKSGEALIWIMKVNEPATCDKYDYYHSGAVFNLTGISDEYIDSATQEIRSSVGLAERKELTGKLLDYIIRQSVEMPVCQFQTVTVYNTETINPESISDLTGYDGFDYVIPILY